MDLLDQIAYRIKNKVPFIFGALTFLGRMATILLYHRAITIANEKANVKGLICGRDGVMRAVTPEDADAMMAMLEKVPEEHLKFFHPHELDRLSVKKILNRKDIMTYGLFVGNEMCAYALLKLFPTKKAYIGRLVAPSLTGLGVGKFLSRFLYWQAAVLGFKPCSTIHEDNMASLKSHASVRPYKIVSKLPNNFQLIRFSLVEDDNTQPVLGIATKQ